MSEATHVDPARSRSLRARVFVLIGAGVFVPLVALGVASWTSLSALRLQLGDERQLLAASFAEHLDDVVRGNLELLQNAATAPRVDPTDVDPAPEHAALREAFLHAHLMRRVFVVDLAMAVLAEEPTPGGTGLPPEAVEAARGALEAGRPTVTNLITTGDGSRRLLLFVPIRDWRGAIAGLAGGEVDPAAAAFATLLRPFRGRPGGAIDLVDAQGAVLATTEAGRQFGTSEFAARASEVIRRERGRRATGAGATVPAETSVAIAPLGTAPWGIVVRERLDASAAALAALRWRLVALIPVLLGVGALFAWGAARSITKPLGLLTRAAERIRAGELSQTIPPLGRDEIGRLGQSLESMRAALEQSIEAVERANEDLERRVEERTRELERLYRELRTRDESRGQLLSKVISAQEDERKRIARELHDETSQMLNALAMGLETTYASAQSAAMRERLAEAKALTVRALDELHRLIYDLRPSILDDLGLLPAVRWFAERHLKPLGISVRCECAEIDQRFTPEFEIAVFRVVQEAITNIARHAEAETVLIECEPSGGDLVIDIEDDGRGFDPGAVTTSGDTQRGLGLLGMRERVELVGGTVRIDSAPGRGTHVSVRVPMPAEVARG
jgi:signal transduction histidine kinase